MNQSEELKMLAVLMLPALFFCLIPGRNTGDLAKDKGKTLELRDIENFKVEEDKNYTKGFLALKVTGNPKNTAVVIDHVLTQKDCPACELDIVVHVSEENTLPFLSLTVPFEADVEQVFLVLKNNLSGKNIDFWRKLLWYFLGSRLRSILLRRSFGTGFM